ncbi:MAG: hypothetical protein EOO28_33440 [Comamonadaceae bacterium]|nr:MAG: hypothetical protein EOO28_33440 [Comamonadaceae bacterium]
MKSTLTIVALALLCSVAGAQPSAAVADLPAAKVESERARVAAERSAAESRFRNEEKACYIRFAVNDCLNEARTRRRVALADLRRQDLSLNEAERKRKGAERLKAIEQKNSSEKQDDAAERRARAINDQRLRNDRTAKKAEIAADNQATAQSRVQTQLGKEATAATKAANRAAKAAS